MLSLLNLKSKTTFQLTLLDNNFQELLWSCQKEWSNHHTLLKEPSLISTVVSLKDISHSLAKSNLNRILLILRQLIRLIVSKKNGFATQSNQLILVKSQKELSWNFWLLVTKIKFHKRLWESGSHKLKSVWHLPMDRSTILIRVYSNHTSKPEVDPSLLLKICLQAHMRLTRRIRSIRYI